MYGAQSSNYPYLFAGMEYDPTGLYHTYDRYYHARLQRFVLEDPLQFAGGDVNLFGYVVDDPVNGTDALGLQFCFYGFAGELAQLDASFAGNFQGALAHAAGQDMGPAAAEAAASAAGFASVGTSSGQAGISGNFSASGGSAVSSVAAAGLSPGQIVLAQADEKANFPGIFFNEIPIGGDLVGGELQGMLRAAPTEAPQTPTLSGLSTAPKVNIPNWIYEQLDARGKVQSRSFYDDTGKPFSRQDFNHEHAELKPHQHNFTYNSKGQRTGNSVIPLPPRIFALKRIFEGGKK